MIGNKAKLVLEGYIEIGGIDYDVSNAPIAESDIIIILLTCSC